MMSLNRFISRALSDWMKGGGPEADIVISSRIRLARNLMDTPFPWVATKEQLETVISKLAAIIEKSKNNEALGRLELIRMDRLNSLERQVLVEKHLISPHLANEARAGAVILSQNESISIMINEEDHLRIQCLFPGFQLEESMGAGQQH